MNNTAMKDKICLDTTDTPDVAEALSRKEPGDEVTYKGKATIDSNSDGMVTLSITEISFAGKAPASPDKAKSAAVKMFEQSEAAPDAESAAEDATETTKQ